MPYKTNAELPEGVKVLPSAAQSIWRNTFNSVDSKGGSEESSIKQSWGAVKNAGYSKNSEGKWVKKEHHDLKKTNVFKADVTVTGVNESLGIVFGWGMITDINGAPYYDTDNLHINSDLMVKATTGFMEDSRTSNDSHTASDIGMVLHSFPLSKEIALSMGVTSNVNGWMVGVKPNKEILQKFVTGEYRGFSIEGEGVIEDEEEEQIEEQRDQRRDRDYRDETEEEERGRV
jgi:cation transport regulator ChaB